MMKRIKKVFPIKMLSIKIFFHICASKFKIGKPQAPSSSFLAFLIVSRSSYIIIQLSFSSFSPKILRLTDLNINSK